MKQAQETGKRIVSKGEYARLISKKMGYGLLALSIVLFVAAGLYMVPTMFRSGTSLLKNGGSSLWAVWYLLSGCAAVPGFYWFLSIAKKRMKEALRKENVIPLTRANTADLPAPDSLVRASSEPAQVQEAVLLRAAVQKQAQPEEQLLRAAGGQE